MRTDRTILINHAIALLLVAAATALRAALSGSDPSAAFVLSAAAVAAASWRGGVSSGIVATLAALLSARLLSRVDLTASSLFVAEGLLITAFATRASRAVRAAADLLSSADRRIGGLLAAQKRLRAIEAARTRLEQVARDCAAFLVDDRARIVEWGDGATQMFGWRPEAIGGRAAQLLASANEAAFEDLLAAVPVEGTRLNHACNRADGTTFDADVEITSIRDDGPRTFVVVVRDLSREHEWRAFAAAAADLQTTLRDEADVAQRQLAMLQCVTDPLLNLMPATQAIAALLDRLRAAIDADGVALIRGDRQRRRILAATDGLQPDAASEWRQADGWIPHSGRILIVHNDQSRVRAASAAGWREDAASLIAVPIASGSFVQGTIEVVDLKPRRSTEWEIALVQVVAAQVAVRLPNESMFEADAVA